MLHNFDERTIFSIDGVFWTLAIEEQLYLEYFLLLPLRERWGWRTTLIVCLKPRGSPGSLLAFLINLLVSGGYRLPHEGGSLGALVLSGPWGQGRLGRGR